MEVIERILLYVILVCFSIYFVFLSYLWVKDIVVIVSDEKIYLQGVRYIPSGWSLVIDFFRIVLVFLAVYASSRQIVSKRK